MNEKIINKINASEDLRIRLETILKTHSCTKNYQCLERKYDELCPVCPLEGTSLLECISSENKNCKYLYSVGNNSFCECEVRVFINEVLKKYLVKKQ